MPQSLVERESLRLSQHPQHLSHLEGRDVSQQTTTQNYLRKQNPLEDLFLMISNQSQKTQNH